MLAHKLRRMQPQGSSTFYETPGTFSFRVPTSTTSISMLCLGGGGSGAPGSSVAVNQGAGGGGGGGLSYSNSVAVTPGEDLTVVVGATGGFSSITNGAGTVLVYARAGTSASGATAGSGGSIAAPAVGAVKWPGAAGAAGSSSQASGGGGGGCGTTYGTYAAGTLQAVADRGGGSGMSFVLNGSKNGYSGSANPGNSYLGISAPVGGGGGGGIKDSAGNAYAAGSGGRGLAILLLGGRVFSSSTSF